MPTPADSILVLKEQLRKASLDITALEAVCAHTLALIAAAGGRVEISAADHDRWSALPWRHEFDGSRHVFSVDFTGASVQGANNDQ